MPKITEPVIELLAIKLYEHDTQGDRAGKITYTGERQCWAQVAEEDRELYRRMARGEDELYGE